MANAGLTVPHAPRLLQISVAEGRPTARFFGGFLRVSRTSGMRSAVPVLGLQSDV